MALALAPALSFTLEKPLYVALPALAYGGVMLFVHREARRGRDYIKLSYYLALSVTAAAWFPASGSAGSVLLYQSAAMIYGMVIMRGRERAVAVGVQIAMVTGLVSLERVYPGWVQPFPSEAARQIQMVVGFASSVAIASSILVAIVSAYDRERARLSREIHDTLLQSLVGIALQFDAMANDPDGNSDSQKERFVRMRKQVEEYIREARQSIWDLRSPKLKSQDLVTALRDAGERATATTAVRFALSVKGTPRRLPARVEEQVLRIGQEAVVNAVRHARAGHVTVELDYDQARLVLHVQDDGQGFEPGRVPSSHGSGHYGLTSMRERAEGVGGSLRVDSAPGRGTHIEATVPIAPASGKGV